MNIKVESSFALNSEGKPVKILDSPEEMSIVIIIKDKRKKKLRNEKEVFTFDIFAQKFYTNYTSENVMKLYSFVAFSTLGCISCKFI